MKCGHIANSIDGGGNPCCAICGGLTPNARIVEEEIPNLKGRLAKCGECGHIKPSDFDLPFFEYCGRGSRYDLNTLYHYREEFCKLGGLDLDSYYCGCRGWE